MALVGNICRDALREIGVISAEEAGDAADLQLALLRFQMQIDAWAAERLTLSVQGAQAITWPANTSTQTIGPTGGNITAQRPVWINAINYVNPGSSPAVEVNMGPMNADQYALLAIKGLQSGLPIQFFYQTSLDTVVGTLFIWPQPTGSLTLNLYAPQAVTVPVTLFDNLLGPPGYQEAFMYQLALRLLTPFARKAADLPALPGLAADAFARMKRPNNQPSLLGIDPALVPATGGGYNILSDTYTGYTG